MTKNTNTSLKSELEQLEAERARVIADLDTQIKNKRAEQAKQHTQEHEQSVEQKRLEIEQLINEFNAVGSEQRTRLGNLFDMLADIPQGPKLIRFNTTSWSNCWPSGDDYALELMRRRHLAAVDVQITEVHLPWPRQPVVNIEAPETPQHRSKGGKSRREN